ncbi:hypothetical protein [Rhodococcus koreensis]|uniref:hypothetical protein n=1 Tax=Rhodococcus koreensis TaxID=99653 RepID=UPI00366F7956
MATKAERHADEVARLARNGMGRNQIAETLGLSTGTVTRAAKLRGVEFDRAATIKATEALIHDARKSRADLSLRMLALAHEAVGAANQALADGEAGDFRNYVVGAGVAQDKHLALDQHVTAARSLSDVDAWTAHILGRTEDDKNVAALESDEDIAADVAAMMAAARQPTAIEGTP